MSPQRHADVRSQLPRADGTNSTLLMPDTEANPQAPGIIMRGCVFLRIWIGRNLFGKRRIRRYLSGLSTTFCRTDEQQDDSRRDLDQAREKTGPDPSPQDLQPTDVVVETGRPVGGCLDRTEQAHSQRQQSGWDRQPRRFRPTHHRHHCYDQRSEEVQVEQNQECQKDINRIHPSPLRKRNPLDRSGAAPATAPNTITVAHLSLLFLSLSLLTKEKSHLGARWLFGVR